jgi:hypothetical protein
MSLFKSKKKEKDMTLQEVEQAFNQLQFEVGSFNYLIDLKTQEINIYSDEISMRLEKMRELARRGNVLRGKIQNELEETIKKGETVESSLN